MGSALTPTSERRVFSCGRSERRPTGRGVEGSLLSEAVQMSVTATVLETRVGREVFPSYMLFNLAAS